MNEADVALHRDDSIISSMHRAMEENNQHCTQTRICRQDDAENNDPKQVLLSSMNVQIEYMVQDCFSCPVATNLFPT